MATTDLLIKDEKDETPQSFSKNFDQFGNSSGFIFDVSLSTAIAADGKNEKGAPQPKGPLSPKMLDKMTRYWRAANYLFIGRSTYLKVLFCFSRSRHRRTSHGCSLILEHLEDMPEIRNWQWTRDFSAAAAPTPMAKGQPEKAMFTDSLGASS